MVVGTLYMAQSDGLEIAGLNLFPARLLGYVCFLRVLTRREFSLTQLVRADKVFIVLYLFAALVPLVRAEEIKLTYIAKMLDNLLTYFAFRGLLRLPDEFRWLLKILAVLLVPYVAILAIESATGRNLFVLVGQESNVWLREGTPRCFGSFRHPSLLGSLGACFLPLFIALAFDPTVRRRAIIGAVACVAIVGFSNSGSPLSLLMVAILGWFLWPLRTRMQTFRRGMVAFFVLMAFAMKAPIWYLPAKLSNFTGGTGWHRSYLMDVTFQHFDQWWLAGMPVQQTSGWMPYNLSATGGADITNQFISFGLNAGILAMALFIFVIYCGFSHLGAALNVLREADMSRSEEALLWGLGVALAAHVFNWIGITYFDQFNVLWLLQFAALVTLSSYWIRHSFESPLETEESVTFPAVASQVQTWGEDPLLLGQARGRFSCGEQR
jgi:hypothetical protein